MAGNVSRRDTQRTAEMRRRKKEEARGKKDLRVFS
jgi:hypothetical protein